MSKMNENKEKVHEWYPIEEFGGHLINRAGEIYNTRTQSIMRTSENNHGNLKITLTKPGDRGRHTRSVALLVAKTFLSEPEHILFDAVICLDGDITNVNVTNLAWRPQWHAYSYSRQFRTKTPLHYLTIPVEEWSSTMEDGNLLIDTYPSVVEAASAQGVLFGDIWASATRGIPVFPHYHTYKLIKEQ